MNRRTHRRALLAACAAIAPATVALAQEPVSLEAPTVEVIGTTPLPGLGVPVEQVPSNVQAVTDQQIEDRQAINLPDLMTRSLPSVNVNEVTGNPYQADLNYRGFQVSPLLGTPQGLSVFQDGVRLNEPFGDVVYWDLIPQQAISTINLIPGSNPVFGLNTLGGALSLRTKTGAHYPNTGIAVSGGSWDRWTVDAEHGGYTDTKDYYFSASYFDEEGWRDFSPSEVKQFFAKIGHETADTDLDLSFTFGDTDLTGNGVAPQSMLERRREQVFTVPDNTTKDMWMLNLTGSRVLSDTWQLGGNVYYRHNRVHTLNGDGNDDYEDCVEGGGVDCTIAVNNRTRTDEDVYGATLQLYYSTERHRLTLGSSIDRGESDFAQTATEGTFDQDRRVVETEAEEEENELEGSTTTWSVYATDTWNVAARTHLTLSARYNYTTVKTDDLLTPTPPNLDADHSYKSLNPAIGVTHALAGGTVLFAGWSQGTRAPSPIELGCADPNNPCSLPNAMQADPFLEQITARTWEAGARGRLGERLSWVASAFHTDNYDDILFVSEGTPSQGFFTNFGETRRQGLELGLTGTMGKWQWFANYAYIRATFQSSACLLSENNSTRGTSPDCVGDDEIRVGSGDSIPGIPEHQFKLGVDFRPTERLTLGLDVSAFSQQFARGNENNKHRAGTFTDQFGETRTFQGPGEVDAYAVFNLTGRYRFARNWEVFARIDNLFDTEYETAAILAENPFDANDQFQANPDDWARETFFAPGAPRAAWVGVRFAIDRKPRR